jgi:hypothetical protein
MQAPNLEPPPRLFILHPLNEGWKKEGKWGFNCMGSELGGRRWKVQT